jgi:rhodanese-related sulfurtransferase
VVRVFDTVAAVTGLTETQAKRHGLPYAVAYLPGVNHAGYYPGAEPMLLKLLYHAESEKLLGAQCVGGSGVDKRIDVISTALAAGMTVRDLEDLDLCYAPPFGAAKDTIIQAGFAASNMQRGVTPTLTPAELLRELNGADPPLLIDVRTTREFKKGHLPSALNLPVDELRGNIEDIRGERPIVVYCKSGHRSYFAQQILMNSGHRSVRNLVGGYDLVKRVQAAAEH